MSHAIFRRPDLAATALPRRRVLAGLGLGLGLAACGRGPESEPHPGATAELDRLIRQYARQYDTPESLFHRVIDRESDYNPLARNGPYYGLMQISYATAQSMGYQGPPEGLLDAETNLKYAGKYLRGAWIVSGHDQDEAIYWYSAGYYYEAKRLGLLDEVGLG